MANPWFRMYAEFATDPKVQMLSEADQRRFTMLLCFRCNDHVTLQDEEVTFLLRISNDEWQQTKALFIKHGFINSNNEILNWDKRQFKSDTSKNRVSAYRERNKQKSNGNVTLLKQKSNAVDTEQNRTEHINTHLADVDKKILIDYLKVRKAKKAGEFTETAFNAIKKESEKVGLSIDEALAYCCKRSWVGFESAWYLKDNESKKPRAFSL